MTGGHIMAQNLGYDDTPILPGTNWHVHDGNRPQPRVVTPGTPCCDDILLTPPSDAVVLFDGTDLSKWQSKNTGGPAEWKVENGYMEVVPGTGYIQTKEEFGDCQLHVEFACPAEVKGEGQGRGNSGVFLMGRYEVQVLDCYDNPTYPDGTTGAIYGQTPPLVNACRPPGEWQTYDIIWEGPRFDGDKLVKPACITVLQNGIVLHHHRELRGVTSHKVVTDYEPHPEVGPLELQDHGDLVRFRNIWYRPLTDYDEG
ncbi:MAG: DUF1080 domain-containing protein [Armatimonadetes bacterium]|nr:DUF1080 domain-containing protein [Armatimonadota bacterium]